MAEMLPPSPMHPPPAPLSPPPSLPPAPAAPPAFTAKVDWTQLIWVLGGVYTAVALAVVSFSVFRLYRSKTSPQTNHPGTIEQGAASPPVVVATPVVVQATPVSSDGVRLMQATRTPSYRTVKRQNSAWRVNSAPQVDLQSIERAIKMGFIRKVYSILATQLLVTCGIVTGAIYLSFEIPAGEAGPDPSKLTEFGYGVLTRPWIIWVLFVPLLIILCCLHAMKNTYPCNYILLALFTIIESWTLAYVCVAYYSRGFGDQIILSLAVTTGIFLALTVFTMQSKIDWNFLGPGLYACLWILILWSWFSFWLVPASDFTARSLVSLFGAIVFCGFIIYDTNLIMKHLGVDDYIIAAIELYLDFINLFLYLLQFLSACSE